LKQFGVEVRFVDPLDPENYRRATDARTKAYYAETLPNPKLNVFPIKEVADIGRSLGVPLIVDNTAAPLIARRSNTARPSSSIRQRNTSAVMALRLAG